MIFSENRFPLFGIMRVGMPGLAGLMPSMSFFSFGRFRFALAGLLAPQSLRHQFVGEHELGFAHLVYRQQNLRLAACFRIVAAHARGLALGAEQHAAEALAAVDRNFHFDLRQIAGVAVEIGLAHQRPVDAGRGYFQPVGAIDQVGHVEHRRERARDRLAVLHRHAAVRPLGHDLDGAAVGGETFARTSR